MSRVLALAALVASVAGCAGEERAGDYGDGSIRRDGGLVSGRDAGTDASAPSYQDAAQSGDAGGIADGEYGRDPGADFDSCFNGRDDDANGFGDCSDATCRSNVPACCVGSSDATCCVAGDSVPLPIAECGAASVDTCAALTAIAEPFGSPTSRIASHGSESEGLTLVPRGATTDSGLVLREVIDPRVRAITIEARVAGTTGGHTAGADVVGVGLIDAESAASLTHVAPAAAFMISGNRSEVSLILAGEIVQRWPLTGGFHGYALTVRPSGEVVLTRNGSELGAGTLSIERPVRAIVYGRTFNPAPDSPEPVRIASLSMRRDACDVPSALGDGEVVFPPPGDASWDSVRRVASPSVARWVDEIGETHERMALEIDGAIYLASSDGASWRLVGGLGAPALVGGDEWASRLGDPALRWNGTTLELWFTGYDGEVGTVARARAAEGTETFAWSDVEPLLVPVEGGSFSQPAPFPGASSYLVVRARDAAGDSLVLYRETAEGWASIAPLRSASGDLSAFDRDEVGSPRVVGGTVQRLYFAGRRGVRWSIGMLVSPDGLTWIEPDGGALVRTSSGDGFDALGASDPELVIDGETARLFYTGLDGVRARIGIATGAAPPR